MKKLLKKSILASVAVLAVSAVMTMSAFAELSVTPVYENGKLTATIAGANEGDQLTILVVKDGTTTVTETNIVYINQDPAEEGGGKEYEIQLPSDLDEGTYEVRVGTSNAGLTMATGKFKVGGGGSTDGVVIGDVDGEEGFTATDAMHVLQRSVGRRDAFVNDIPDEAGDVDNDQEITATDAMHILQRSVGRRDKFERTDLTLKVKKQ